MPIILNLFLSFFIGVGFFFLGKFLLNIFRLLSIVKLISNPTYQYPVFGVAIFIFILFPFFLLGLFNNNLFKVLTYIIVLIGLLGVLLNINNFSSSIKKYKKIFFNINFEKLLVLTLIILYFFISLAPPTSGDSLSYHLTAAKYINANGSLPVDEMDIEGKLAGIGEFLNAFAISIDAEQFTSFLHFLGLISILGIIKKFSDYKNLSSKNKYLLMLLVLSCPLLIFLIYSSKPQFFYLSLVFISFSFLLIFNYIKKSISIFFKIFFLVNIILIVAVNAKINFFLSFVIVNIVFLYNYIKFFQKKILMKFCFLILFLFIFGLLPFPIWKSINYNYPFYFFFTNPLPVNIPVYVDYLSYSKSYLSEKFPLILFLPSSAGDFTETLGVGCLLVYFFIKYSFKNNKMFIVMAAFFVLIVFFLGQRTSRFYLEIYLFIILVSPHFFEQINNKKFILFFCYGIYVQSLIVILSLIWAVFNMFPGNLSSYQKDKVLSNFADGYELIKWVNSVVPENSTIIIGHRSTFFLNGKYIIPAPLGYMKYDSVHKNYYLEKINKKNPEFILFYGSVLMFNYGEFDFKECVGNLFAEKKNVGYLATRNPFNTKKVKYNGYIYYFDNYKMPNCVKSN